jgi:hypothetical protein
MKKITALAVGILILGFAFASAQDKTQTQAQDQEKAQIKAQTKVQTKAAVKTQTKSEFRHRNRIAFIDENGDGINDLARDADGDGIPNGQDPDWVKPQDGTGYQQQSKKGAGNGAEAAEAKAGYAYQLARDADGDGVPNGQDPDWVKPQDGTGLKAQHKNGQPDESAMTTGQKAGKITKSSFGKGSFRSGTKAAGQMTGAGVCDGTGPKGTAKGKGRH